MGSPGMSGVLGHATVKPQPEPPRQLRPLGNGFDIDPADTPSPAGPEGLHGRLLDGESDRELPLWAPIRLTDGNFLTREHPAGKAATGSSECPLDAFDLDDIDPTADDHDPPGTGSREE